MCDDVGTTRTPALLACVKTSPTTGRPEPGEGDSEHLAEGDLFGICFNFTRTKISLRLGYEQLLNYVLNTDMPIIATWLLGFCICTITVCTDGVFTFFDLEVLCRQWLPLNTHGGKVEPGRKVVPCTTCLTVRKNSPVRSTNWWLLRVPLVHLQVLYRSSALTPCPPPPPSPPPPLYRFSLWPGCTPPETVSPGFCVLIFLPLPNLSSFTNKGQVGIRVDSHSNKE